MSHLSLCLSQHPSYLLSIKSAYPNTHPISHVPRLNLSVGTAYPTSRPLNRSIGSAYPKNESIIQKRLLSEDFPTIRKCSSQASSINRKCLCADSSYQCEVLIARLMLPMGGKVLIPRLTLCTTGEGVFMQKEYSISLMRRFGGLRAPPAPGAPAVCLSTTGPQHWLTVFKSCLMPNGYKVLVCRQKVPGVRRYGGIATSFVIA